HPAVAFDERDHAHRHTVVTHVDVRLKVVDARQLADRLYEPGACRKRPSPEVRVRTVAQDAPLVDTLLLAELLRADLIGSAGLSGHAALLVTEYSASGSPSSRLRT